MSKLLFDKPASIWEEAIPLGNGRIGAMVYGTVEEERIQVNEESIWRGGKVDRNNPDTLANLPRVRKLLMDGQIGAAQELMLDVMSGRPAGMQPYQTLGEITITFENRGEVSMYSRTLDMDTAISRVSYVADHTTYEREYMISYPADCMIMKYTAKGEEKLNFTVALSRGGEDERIAQTGPATISLYGGLGEGGFLFATSLFAQTHDGTISVENHRLMVRDASEVILYYGADCTFHHDETTTTDDLLRVIGESLLQADKLGYTALQEAHIADYQSLYQRCVLQLMGDPKEENIPTDERIRRAKEGLGIKELTETYFNFGRYLLISCSRAGGLPATLQGLWNKDMTPPWESKFTININTEMNYWPAENGNLSECHMPLFDLIERMVPNGRKTARVMYGCRGFVAHHNTDIHGDTAPQDLWIPGTFWVMGAAWLCTHQWTHYLYTQDLAFLQRTYPVMAEAALFFLDFLVEYHGNLVTIPSVSPENTYILPSGEQGANGIGVTMDNQILRDLFTQCVKAYETLQEKDALTDQVLKRCEEAEILDVDAFTEEIKAAREKLIPTRISERGTIMEWQEDYKEAEPGHRHISHLYGLHPSAQITMDGTPDLAQAAAKTLESRLSCGGGHTGWSRAWIINHYAKLWDGEKAYENIRSLFASSTYPNMFDMHPPFQIDGNFGATAGVMEMLLQSNEERTVLLPALPKAWENGSIRGMKAVGGATVSITWKNHSLDTCIITSDKPLQMKLCYQGKTCIIQSKRSEEIVVTPQTFQ